ncbi:putative tick transposon [Operophtera brumata]|uniref:Putative tick transposon n=1 Tax=Operophtera brumata TaxID=104452 RepID=A0A0L7KQT6_OPEBR|nr:putative tick transposon [Operophtera brumata]
MAKSTLVSLEKFISPIEQKFVMVMKELKKLEEKIYKLENKNQLTTNNAGSGNNTPTVRDPSIAMHTSTAERQQYTREAKRLTHTSLVANAPSQTPSTAAITTDETRPVRTARVQASAAIAGSSSASSKRRNGRVSTAVTPKSDIATINIPEKFKLGCGNETALQSDVLAATQKVTKRDDDKTESQWQVVNKRRRSKQQTPMIVGTAADNDELQAAERVRHIQAWCFKPDTMTATVLSFLNKMIKSDFTVVKREIKLERHASFLSGMLEKVYDKVTSPTAWPAGVRFTEWFLFRPRDQRGAASVPPAAAGGARAPSIARGGSCIYARKDIKFKAIEYSFISVEQVCEISAVELTDYNIVIVCVYRSNLTYPLQFFPCLERLLDKLVDSENDCVVIGDFNIDYLCPSNSDQKHLNYILNTRDYCNFIDFPTRVSTLTSTCIDHAYVSSERVRAGTVRASVVDSQLSDHYAVRA